MKTKERSMREIQHHLENTAWRLIKIYNKKQLAMMDWIKPMYIEKRPDKYLPVRLDKASMSWKYYTPGRTARKPYSIWYIRLDEVKGIYRKRTGRNLISY